MAEGGYSNEDEVFEENQTSDMDKPWAPGAPSALPDFKRREREAEARWKASLATRKFRDTDVSRPRGGQIGRSPPDNLNQIMFNISQALKYLGTVQRATRASNQQEIYSIMVAVHQLMKQINAVINQSLREQWQSGRRPLKKVLDELNVVMSNPGVSIEALRIAGDKAGQVLIYLKKTFHPLMMQEMMDPRGRAHTDAYAYARAQRQRDSMNVLQAPRNYPQPQPPPVVPDYFRPEDHLAVPPVRRNRGSRSPSPRPLGMYFEQPPSLEDLSLGELTPKTLPPKPPRTPTPPQ